MLSCTEILNVISDSYLEEVPADGDGQKDVDDDHDDGEQAALESTNDKEQDAEDDGGNTANDVHDLVEPDDLTRRLLVLNLEPIEPEEGGVTAHERIEYIDNQR